MNYVSDYIKRALENEKLEPPDKDRAGDHIELLESLHENHQRGGTNAARIGWDTMKRLDPSLEALLRTSHLIHADELGSLTQPAYLLESYPVYANGLNVVAGPSGSGKSFLTLDISSRISLNHPVIYIAGEGLPGYAARWYAWKKHNHIEPNRKLSLYFYDEAVQMLEEHQLQQFINNVKADLKGLSPQLIVIDTLARSAVGMEENSNKDMGEFVASCDVLRNELGAGVVVVHHTGKSGEIRGATALYSAADSVLRVIRDDGIIRVINKNERGGKNKYAEGESDRTYVILPVNCEDEHGNAYEGAVLAEAELHRADGSLSENQRLILEFLRPHGESGQKVADIVGATEIKQATVYRTINKLLDMSFVDKTSDGFYSITDMGLGALGGNDE